MTAAFPANTALHFAATRRHFREMLEVTPEGQELNDIVYELLS